MADSLVKYLRNRTNSDSEMDDYQRLEMDAVHLNASSKLALIDDDDESLAPSNPNNTSCSASVTRGKRSFCCVKSWFNDIRFFTAVLFCLSAADAVFWYATTGILSSVERRYSFSSGSMGVLYMMPEFGRLTILLFISHFGNRFNKSKVIAVCFTLASICISLMAVPHFTIEYHPDTSSKDPSNILCTPLGSPNSPHLTSTTSRTFVSHEEAEETRHSSQAAFTIISVVFFFFGMAESPMESLGTTYLVDNSRGTKSTFYVAMVESGWSIGPLLGMLLSAWMTSIYVEVTESTTLTPSDPSWVGAWWLALLICALLLFLPCPFLWYFPHDMKVQESKKTLALTVSERNIDIDSVIPPSTDFLVRRLSDDNDEINTPVFQNHSTIPGEIASSELTNPVSNFESQTSSDLGNGDVVTLHTTGKHITEINPNPSEVYDEDVHETDIHMPDPVPATDPHDEMDEADDTRVIHKEMNRELYNWTGMLRSLQRVLTNPAFVWLVIGLAFRSFSGWGMESFFPKYLEVQFSIPEWEASVMAGVMMGLAYGSARVLSGCLVHITNMSLRRSFFWCALLTLVSSLLGAANMFLGCESPELRDYKSNFTISIDKAGNETKFDRCFASCDCSDTVYSPVCDAGVTYYSPCYASCHTTANNETGVKLSYLGCACTDTGRAVPGECETGCNMIVPFSIVTIAAFCMIAYTSPQLIVFTTRCVEKRDRALGFAVSIWTMSIFGWLPAPYINGLLVDSACTAWEMIGIGGDATQGSCWLYDLTDLRLKLQGLNAACRLCQFICFCLVYYYSRNKFEQWEHESDDEIECLPEMEEHQNLLDATDSS